LPPGEDAGDDRAMPPKATTPKRSHMHEMPVPLTGPPELAAVRHILGAPAIAARTEPYLFADNVDFAGLERETETMSNGEALLVRIAYELWNAEKRSGLWELVRSLDQRNFERVVEALWLARGATAHDIVAVIVRRASSEQLAA
jgi:hypothetical protein